MSDLSKSELANKIKSEYNKKLKDLEAKLAIKHKELIQVEKAINHDTKVIDHSNLHNLKSKKGEINGTMILLKKEIKKVKKEEIKRLRKL
jgi:hypothetical protein